jgi:hypothetical protein
MFLLLSYKKDVFLISPYLVFCGISPHNLDMKSLIFTHIGLCHAVEVITSLFTLILNRQYYQDFVHADLRQNCYELNFRLLIN